MNRSAATLFIIVTALCFVLEFEAKTIDPYKVLGVDKTASQLEIQKAFLKLSLHYHPDKNKAKGAQEKFAQINNAYQILSDEQKRKNYDLYGDKKGNPGFEAGHPGGYGGPGHSGFNFSPGEQWSSGDQGGSKSFFFSFGDLIGNFFGDFGSSFRSQFGPKCSPKSFKAINSNIFKNEIVDQGMTWLLLFYTPSMRCTQQFESIIGEVSSTLQGALKVGSINCEKESLCKDFGIYPRNAPRVFVYSSNNMGMKKGSLLEYMNYLTVKDLKAFCQQNLPRFSKRIDLNQLDQFITTGKLPKVLLLSSKKNTPVIWRVLSGLYRKRITFGDVEVHDSDLRVEKLGVDALPAIVGWLPNGEKIILKTGVSVKDVKSGVQDLSNILDSFEKVSKKETSSQSKKAQTDSEDGHIQLLSQSNFEALCGQKTPVCIIGAFRSSKAREKLESLFSLVSHMSLSRKPNGGDSSSDSISYVLLDSAQQQSFLNAFGKVGYKSSESDNLLIAYNTRKGDFSVFMGDMTIEEVENFIGSVLRGDIPWGNT